MVGGVFTAYALWHLGYPDQARKRIHEALALTQKLSHPFSLALALNWAAVSHQFRQEGRLAQDRAEAAITLSTEQGFPFCVAWGTILRGWALVERAALSGAREQGEAGLVQLREGLAAVRATEAELWVPLLLGALAQCYAQSGQAEDGLRVVAEALALVEKNEERWNEAELYRIKGELLLVQAREVETPR